MDCLVKWYDLAYGFGGSQQHAPTAVPGYPYRIKSLARIRSRVDLVFVIIALVCYQVSTCETPDRHEHDMTG